MEGIHRSSFIRNLVSLGIISAVLSACLTGGGGAESGAEVGGANENDIEHEVSGSVGDGPIVGAIVRIRRNDGTEIVQLESDASANYNIVVRTKGKFYPLSVDARSGTDIVTNNSPDFDLLSAVLEPGKKSNANVNPFSTFSVELARDLPGGVDKSNIATAQDIVVTELNNGLSTLVVSGVIATKIESSNIAEVIRASEALGETVRRTRDALRANGFSTTGNNVVRAVSSDLTDHVVDGMGGSRADPRFAAVWNIVSAQVLLETMANELHVDGANATNLMSNAMNQVLAGQADPSLAELAVTSQMLSRARVGLVAAHAITDDPDIADLLTDVKAIQAGSDSSTIQNVALPRDYRSRLDNALMLVAGGSTSDIETVNEISRNRTQEIDIGPVTGSTTLSWSAPTGNEDGTTLTDLAGYKIYWGTTPGTYPNSVTIRDKDAATYTVENLFPGTYEFVATSFNSTGAESRFSAPITRVIL
jgi:hypothetical protein